MMNESHLSKPILPLLEINQLHKTFPLPPHSIHKKTTALTAVDHVSFSIFPNEIFGLIGESGSGKSTLGHMVVKLHNPDSGDIILDGEPIHKYPRLAYARKVQMIFQNSSFALDPKMTLEEILTVPLKLHKICPKDQIPSELKKLCDYMGLPQHYLQKYPHELSGGEKQRMMIGKALSVKPELLVCDEIVSALDMSVQGRILNLLLDLKEALGLTLLFISHDLNIVRHMADRVAVMEKGRIVELDKTQSIFETPKADYTQMLLSSYLGQ